VIAGPSGVGKGSVVKELLSRDPDRLVLSVSATTRPPRAGELDGRDYSFESNDRFEDMAARGALLEWAEVFGNKYGTPRDFVDGQLANGKDVILEIDVQGARQVRDQVRDAILILLEPPALDELARRLRGRGTESEEKIARRLAAAERELAERDWFDHVVVNDDLQRASSQVAAIIEASHSHQ
jgi:guanylate kinase